MKQVYDAVVVSQSAATRPELTSLVDAIRTLH